MPINHLLDELREGRISFREAIQTREIPEKLLHKLLCDYTSWFLEQEIRAGRQIPALHWKCLQGKRLWIKKVASDADLGRVRAMLQQKLSDAEDNHEAFIKRFVWAMTFSSSYRGFHLLFDLFQRYELSGFAPRALPPYATVKEMHEAWLTKQCVSLLEQYELEHQRILEWLQSEQNRASFVEALRKKDNKQPQHIGALLAKTFAHQAR